MSELKTGHGHSKAFYQLKSITNTKAVEPMPTKKTSENRHGFPPPLTCCFMTQTRFFPRTKGLPTEVSAAPQRGDSEAAEAAASLTAADMTEEGGPRTKKSPFAVFVIYQSKCILSFLPAWPENHFCSMSADSNCDHFFRPI